MQLSLDFKFQKYHIWKYGETDDHLIRTTDYSLPGHLDGHVELIQPTTIFARWNKMKATFHFDKDSFKETQIAKFFSGGSQETDSTNGAPAVDPSCNATVTVGCLQQLYNIGDYKPQAVQNNSIGISSYLEEFVNEQDLQSFYREQRPEAVNSTFKFISVNGEKCLFLLGLQR